MGEEDWMDNARAGSKTMDDGFHSEVNHLG